jgi:8-oxo-dGTP pyrophosphatase MutT (NUDIX family)
MERHFTVTGFVSHRGRTALHWHRLGAWLPPGGHIERDEDPLQAVLREVREETGLDVDVIPTPPPFAYTDPRQLPAPAAMAVYDLGEGDRSLPQHHQHIDLIYFTRPSQDGAGALPEEEDWLWASEDELRRDLLVHPVTGRSAAVADDVRELALAAIAAERQPPCAPVTRGGQG